MGGRSTGRSYFVSQYATQKMIAEDYFRCAIMRFVLTDVRHSILQEIKDRITEQEIEDMFKFSGLDIKYNQNEIHGKGFRKSSGDQKSKLKSLAGYNCIIIEEADEVAEEDFLQLDDSIRTMKGDITIFLLLNPPHKNHWIIKRFFNLIPSGVEGFYMPELRKDLDDTLFIHGTYKDNIKNINEKTIRNFERYKETKPDHYYNMIEGLVSEGARGRIYKDWQVITDKEYNALPYPEEYGLDFGFTNDPASLVGIKTHNNKVWIKELIYETGLTNQMLASRMHALGVDGIVYADSAEPKSIVELQREGLNVVGVKKGQDSIRSGIDLLLSREVYYTQSSNNIANETQEYKWGLDRNKEPTNKPDTGQADHAMDAIRYCIMGQNENNFVGFV